MYLGVPVLQLVGFIKHGHMPRDSQHVFNVAPVPVSEVVKNWQMASTSLRCCEELATGLRCCEELAVGKHQSQVL